MNYPFLKRHYAKVEGLAPRTSGDISREAMIGRALGMGFLDELSHALPKDPSLISTAHGEFTELLLTIPAYAVRPPLPGSENPIGIVYRHLLSTLDPKTSLIVLTHESVQDSILRWLDIST